MKFPAATLALLVATPLAGASEAWFEAAERALTFSALNHELRARVSGTLTAEAYAMSRPTPGLVFTDAKWQFTPRLAMFGDAQFGRHLFGFTQVRIDRGFDPTNSALRGRLDEIALRLVPWRDGRLNVQVGQFATVIGNWAPRHDPRDNPFVTAPLPYEHLTTIYDGAAAASAGEFVQFDDDEKYEYNPIIWGPVYATGLAVSGRLGHFTGAIEVKNSGPSSRPHTWSFTRTGFEHPAIAARLGFKPDLRWSLGASFSDSIYFLPGAGPTLPPGTSRADFRERLLGLDASFAWKHLQLWAEVFHARFDVPRVGSVQTVAGYVEGKYKLTPQFYGALRLNIQDFSRIATSPRRRERWARDIRRVDGAIGYRFTTQLDAKLQASVEDHRDLTRGANLNFAGQVNARF